MLLGGAGTEPASLFQIEGSARARARFIAIFGLGPQTPA
jgi:hypothetical protein